MDAEGFYLVVDGELVPLGTDETPDPVADNPFPNVLLRSDHINLERLQLATIVAGLGFRFSRSGDRIIVEDVFSGSPAETMGLQVDDVIIAVDGRSDQTSLEYITGGAGTDVELTVLRGTQTVVLVGRRGYGLGSNGGFEWEPVPFYYVLESDDSSGKGYAKLIPEYPLRIGRWCYLEPFYDTTPGTYCFVVAR